MFSSFARLNSISPVLKRSMILLGQSSFNYQKFEYLYGKYESNEYDRTIKVEKRKAEVTI